MNSHPALVNHAQTGGSTFRDTVSLSGKNRWAVGVSPETARSSPTGFTDDDYNQFTAQHANVLASNPNAAVGTYHDPATGIHHLELVGFSPSQTASSTIGAQQGEGSVFHLGTNQTVSTGHNGDRPLHPYTASERLQELAQSDLPSEPFTGVHFSDAKLDTIDGARRGASGVGAEAKRLRLGSSTGLGPDAPPGFHVYDANSLAEPQIATRKNAHPVSGRFAFGSTSSPQFQDAYHNTHDLAKQSGADDETARGLASNAGEHALFSAGYDGLHNPSQPSTRLIFGSHALPAKQTQNV